jgi:hypothetical protein
MTSDVADKYEPLPSIPQLPRWVWRKLPTPGRVAVALIPVAAVVLAIVLGPGIARDKEERADAERQRVEQAREERVRRLRREQRPLFVNAVPPIAGAAPDEQLVVRERAVDTAADAVLDDAHRRRMEGDLDGPIRRVVCEPYPRTVDGRGAHESLDEPTGRYSCLAVTAVARGNESQQGSLIGHPYRVLIDFERGRIGLCKISGRAGEGSIGQAPVVPVPKACGGS